MHRLLATIGIVLVSTALLGLASPATASPYTDVVLGDNPVSYWRLGESGGSTAFDSAGTHDAAYSGTINYNEPGAIVGDTDTAVDLAGGYAVKSWTAELNTPVFTVESWVRADLIDVNWRTPYMNRWVDSSSGSPLCYGSNFYKDQTNHNWEFWIGRGSTTPGFASLNGPQVEEGEWTHLVGSYDGTTMRFHVNGELVGSATITYEPVPTDKSTFKIGTGAASWIGGMDEMAYYDTALTPEQVAIHHAVGRYRPVADVVTFHLDEGTGSTIHDSGHNEATGALQNGTGWTTGKYGNALSFDGIDDYADCGNDTSLLCPDEITIEAWINPTDITGRREIATKEGSYYFNVIDGKVGVDLAGTSTPGHFETGALISAGEWSHVAATWDGNDVTVYVDGIAEATGTTTGTMASTSSHLFLGAMRGGATVYFPFAGALDELAIYSYALTPGEILARANAGPPVATPEPGSIVLLALGLLGLLVRRRRRVGQY